jgi:hypothetical protein
VRACRTITSFRRGRSTSVVPLHHPLDVLIVTNVRDPPSTVRHLSAAEVEAFDA